MSLIESLESRKLYAAAPLFGTIVKGYGTNGVSSAPTLGGADNGNIEALPVSGGKTLVGVGGGLTRFNADGSLDTTFGTSGITLFKRVSLIDDAVDSSGRIYALVGGASGTLLQRYTAAGKLDSTFGTSGSALVTSGRAFTAKAIDIQADGKVVVAGNYAPDDNNTVTRVYRLTTGGTPDSGFGTSGVAEFKLGPTDLILPNVNDRVVEVRVLSNNKIEVLGSSYNDDGSGTAGNGLVALARLTSGGTPDSSFGSGGVARRATFDDVGVGVDTGVIRSDGSAVVSQTSAGRTVFVGLSTSGGTVFNRYYSAASGVGSAVDVTDLGDGRVAFVNDAGGTWTVGADGSVSNVVRPVLALTGSANAITAVNGYLILADVNNPYVRVTEITPGKLNGARPDNLPAAAAISTAYDSLGGLHIAFFDAATKTLKYDYRNSQGYWTGVRTVDATPGAGAALSISTFVAKNRAYAAIAYYDANTADLKIATTATLGRKFALGTIASKGAVGLSPSLQYTDGGGYAVTYYSKTTKSLYYALNNGTGWATELVDSGGAGLSNELKFDPDSRRPAIAYTKADNTVWYAFKGKASTWADGRTKVATTKAGAAFVNLDLPTSVTYEGGPRISYYDGFGADLVLAKFNRNAAKNQRWSTQVIASRGLVGAYNDVSVPSYTFYNNSATLYAWSRSGDSVNEYDYDDNSGNTTVINLATGGGKNLSVATDPSSSAVAIAYEDTASGLTFVR